MERFERFSILKNYYITIFYLLFFTPLVFAEGSKELSSNGGQRAFLFSSTTGTNVAPYPTLAFPTLGTMKVYVNVGETIYLGSSAQGVGGGRMNLRAPDGSTYTSGASTTIGRISNRTQESAGPLPNASGYTPYTRLVAAGQAGVWEIDFISPNVNGVTTLPADITASSNWTQGTTTAYVTAFDITVRNIANTAFLTGRAFTNIFSGCLGASNAKFYGKFKVITKDGYIYDVDNNGQAGYVFSFFANNKGFRTAAGAASYKSTTSIANPPVQDPRADDSGTDITHKLFFNTPNTDLPTSASTPTGTTWLLNTLLSPIVTGFTFNGIEGTSGLVGSNPLGGYLGFSANQAGSYIINIDINQNGVFTDAVDRKLIGSAVSGNNQIYWDGLNGLGAKIVGSVSFSASSIKITLVGGEVHFPFIDVENNPGGIIITRTNGIGAGDDIVYYDDTNISGGTANLVGGSSAASGHKWGSTAYALGAFGNDVGLDTWTYILSTPLLPATTVQFTEADLEIVSITPSKSNFCMGVSQSYTVKLKNNGPSAATGVTFEFVYPSDFSSVSVSKSISGTSSISSESTTTSKYTAVVNMNNAAIITFVITGTVAKLPSAYNISVDASVLRPADVTDPDAVNPDATAPTNVQSECDSAPSGTGCNNIKTATTPVNKVATPSISVI